MVEIRTLLSQITVIEKQLPHPEALVGELLFDSRRLILPEKTIFFAIKSKNNDGHFYIPELVGKGVRNFIVTNKLDEFSNYQDCNFLQVGDSVMALQQIASANRKQYHIPVIGITGSNGKTIVKEWLAQMLTPQYRLAVTPNSYNSQIGVPCSVWSLNEMHQ